MRQLKSIITCLTLLTLLGCGGGGADRGGNADLSPGGNAPLPGSVDERSVSLLLEATPIQGDEWSLMLSAEDATDIYQLAGSVLFDPTMYEITSVEAGGGLGGPEDAYFVNSSADEGKLDFGYTSRWFGRVNSGDLNLLRLRVRALGDFSLGDFSLPLEPDSLRVRDSQKRELEPSLRRAGS
ncbi:hypothetical protein KDL29_06770 [bacterium]|nr:hypothetical protein [bacterium]